MVDYKIRIDIDEKMFRVGRKNKGRPKNRKHTINLSWPNTWVDITLSTFFYKSCLPNFKLCDPN